MFSDIGIFTDQKSRCEILGSKMLDRKTLSKSTETTLAYWIAAIAAAQYIRLSRAVECFLQKEWKMSPRSFDRKPAIYFF